MKFLIPIFVVYLCFQESDTTPSPEVTPKCGYQSCHPVKPGLINVHIVPHTHDDVGWLKTIDQYYFGSKQDIQKAGVQYILDSVMEALRKNNERRFIYVETAFFWKWWMKQHDFVKHNVKKFVNNGQLEFVGGAWSMNDEAATHYQSTIDQFTWGLRKLNDTFGACGKPKIGWQIDPFGHSREMASLFSQMGYDGLLLGRIDYQDKSFKFDTKTAEFVWKSSDSLGHNTDLFTSIMYNTYSPPPGFCFDTLCTDEPIIDDKKSPDYNVDKRLSDLLRYLDNQTKAYQTENIILTMGGDFTYMDANMWYKNLDKLIRYGNQKQNNGSKYHLLYSTPSCYLKAVKDNGAEKKINWPLKSDDFFPYASDSNSYWTGYFTSRPTLKRFERVGNNFLQVCKQLYTLVDLGPEDWVDLNRMREAMGVMQHHDAITGTEKQQVAFDYARILSNGFEECQFIAGTALSQLVTGHDPNDQMNQDPVPEIQFESCLLTNISQCDFSEKQNQFIVTVYNPLSRPVDYYVRVPVTAEAYSVFDPSGSKIETDLIPVAEFISKIPGRSSKSKFELVFLANQIPPLGFKSFYVTKESGRQILKKSNENRLKQGNIEIDVDPQTGKISNLQMNGKNVSLVQDFFYYYGAVGNNKIPENRSSGAYIFRPNSSEPVKISKMTSYKIYQGRLVSELHQVFNAWTSQIIRIYNTENHVEFDWIIGPIPNNTDFGKEIITKYTTPLKTDSSFYTDSNGRETLKRVRNFRPTWKLNVTEPVAGNYYPVTTKLSMKDDYDDVEVAILTDRAQGGTSLKDGELELMIHRYCTHDDAFGVGEKLMETAYGKGLVARGSHYVVLGPYLSKSDGVAAEEVDIVQRKILSAWTFLSSTNNSDWDQYRKKYKTEFSGLNSTLPKNVQILTLEPWKGMDFLLRLEHVFEANTDSEHCKPASVNLKNLFSTFDIISYKETTLAANEWLNKKQPQKVPPIGKKMESILSEALVDKMNTYDEAQDLLKWNSLVTRYNRDQMKSNDIWGKGLTYHRHRPSKLSEVEDDFVITLQPMEIKTFVIEIKMKN